jgi:hypothetical protein
MSDTEQKPKRVLSDEQKAKMKAGREAAKARKDAEKAAAAPVVEEKKAPVEGTPDNSDTEQKPKRVLTDEQKAKMKAGREAAKARKEAEKAAAAPVAEEKAPETPKKEKKEKKAPAAPKKEKVEETEPEKATTWQPIIAIVFNLRNDNYEDDGSAGEEWTHDRMYFASEDALRRYLTDRINNWQDDFSGMIRGIADDSPTQIAKYIDHIVGTPFLANHPLSDDFNVCRFSASIHQ